MIADSGYGSEKNLETLEAEKPPERRIEGFIATERQKHGERRVAAHGMLLSFENGQLGRRLRLTRRKKA